MKQRDARLAALAAGGELSPTERHRFDRVCREDGEVERTASELRVLREALLAVREEQAGTGSKDRTIRALRERIASEGAGHGKPWRWVLVPSGLALATLAVGGHAAMAGFQRGNGGASAGGGCCHRCAGIADPRAPAGCQRADSERQPARENRDWAEEAGSKPA